MSDKRHPLLILLEWLHCMQLYVISFVEQKNASKNDRSSIVSEMEQTKRSLSPRKSIPVYSVYY